MRGVCGSLLRGAGVWRGEVEMKKAKLLKTPTHDWQVCNCLYCVMWMVEQLAIKESEVSSAGAIAPGSQEWAETWGDDFPSYDEPGDDFDM